MKEFMLEYGFLIFIICILLFIDGIISWLENN
jgi:hypothetical protein